MILISINILHGPFQILASLQSLIPGQLFCNQIQNEQRPYLEMTLEDFFGGLYTF